MDDGEGTTVAAGGGGGGAWADAATTEEVESTAVESDLTLRAEGDISPETMAIRSLDMPCGRGSVSGMLMTLE